MDAHEAIEVTVLSHGLVHDCWDEPPVGAHNRTAGGA